jgi:hypothetical protein
MTFLSEVIQSVANLTIALTFVIFIIETRSNRKELKYSTYEKLMHEFSVSALYLADHPEIAAYVNGALEDKSPFKENGLSKEDEMSIFSYLDSLLALLERVWQACVVNKIGERKDWEDWKEWIKALKRTPIFRKVVEENKGYNQDFIDEIKNL